MPDRSPTSTTRLSGYVFVCAAVVAVVLLGLAPRYGFHRDELYFMTNADHPAWGYVDHPPVTPMLGRLSQQLFGDTVFGLRALTALVAASIVIAGAAVSAELGGDRSAAVLTAAGTATTATVLALGHMLTTPTVDVLVWTVSIWLLCRIIRTGDPRWFVLLGAVLGIGLLNKFTVLFAVASFGGALIMLPERRVLASRWTVVGAGVALVLWSPNLWWQARNGWPVFDLSAGIAAEATENRIMAIPFQALFIGPPLAVGVAVGWWRQLRGRALRGSRFIAIGFVILIVLLIVTAGKPYYAAGGLPALTAVAAVQLAEWSRRHERIVVGALAVNGLVTAALVLPLIPVSAVGDSPGSAVNPEPLEMIGWPTFVYQIAVEYENIDDGSGSAVILTANYGEAGAIDRFGPDRNLPSAYSGHNSYADVRRPSGSAGPILVVGYFHPDAFLVGCVALDPIVMPYGIDNEEQGAPLWRCDGPRRSWEQLWPELRHIN
jgi:4-amino-4-deoxy-L-arabinose transferase-like glycosyltransferase